jgi:hypothetical protein
VTQSKPNREDLIRENAKLKEIIRLNTCDKFLGGFFNIIKWPFITIMFLSGCYTLLHIMESLAGKKTVFHFTVDIAVSIILDVAGVAGIIFGYYQWIQKNKDIEKLNSRLEECQKIIDPGRGSSGLSLTGDTNKEDKP